ncbi:hypothetical protein [Streptomyces akebiae]|nr:hypothetical protein [Streptomyces akebiae]
MRAREIPPPPREFTMRTKSTRIAGLLTVLAAVLAVLLAPL